MEVLEAIFFTVNSVRELAKANEDLTEEVTGLSETILAVDSVVQPLLHSKVVLRADIQGVLQPILVTLTQARTALENVQKNRKKSRWDVVPIISYFLKFRSSQDLDNLKGYGEKLRTLVPLLGLALSARQSPANYTPNQGDSFGLAADVITDQEAFDFWVKHFGPKAFEVSCNRFSAAFVHEFGRLCSKSNSHRRTAANGAGSHVPTTPNSTKRALRLVRYMIRFWMDPTDTGVVSMYAWAAFTSEHGIATAISQAYDEATKNRFDPPLRQSSMLLLSPTPAVSEPTRLRRRESLMSTVLISAAESTPYFYLELYGSNKILCSPEAADIMTMAHDSQVDGPILNIGRKQFEKLPKDIKVHISRTHCAIEMKTGGELGAGQSGFYLSDASGNGTWLNDKLVGKNNTILLKDNDRIGILTKKIRMDDEFTTAPSQPAFIAGNDCIVLGSSVKIPVNRLIKQARSLLTPLPTNRSYIFRTGRPSESLRKSVSLLSQPTVLNLMDTLSSEVEQQVMNHLFDPNERISRRLSNTSRRQSSSFPTLELGNLKLDDSDDSITGSSDNSSRKKRGALMIAMDNIPPPPSSKRTKESESSTDNWASPVPARMPNIVVTPPLLETNVSRTRFPALSPEPISQHALSKSNGAILNKKRKSMSPVSSDEQFILQSSFDSATAGSVRGNHSTRSPSKLASPSKRSKTRELDSNESI